MQIVTAAVIVRDGKILAVRRAKGQAHEGKWEFPGGKLEPDETEKVCLERELREELGIGGWTGAYVGESRYAYEKGEILLRAYFFNWTDGEIALTVHDEMRWMNPTDLPTLDFTPADIPIARNLSERE